MPEKIFGSLEKPEPDKNIKKEELKNVTVDHQDGIQETFDKTTSKAEEFLGEAAHALDKALPEE
ncbi:hypothetical protein [Lactococcus taiwanensis]|jgi:hypothetical protein|uniref:Uncharacterized protein n=1 Tax=Lactococcus taiwanensis TaxID=1151742 RepID=A0AA45QQN2_9LACT|nr:hypothetical protein [Lactococcus taiwanensis]KZK37374.1 hypothetical protein P7266_1459 [Lactococcus cremoris]QRZ11474.1 hypothetical protein JVB21_02165 [Lactococcus taiwanensis]QSE76109.1 hypothetical protein JW886_06465 [Lactococcus taiwanensis]